MRQVTPTSAELPWAALKGRMLVAVTRSSPSSTAVETSFGGDRLAVTMKSLSHALLH